MASASSASSESSSQPSLPSGAEASAIRSSKRAFSYISDNETVKEINRLLKDLEAAPKEVDPNRVYRNTNVPGSTHPDTIREMEQWAIRASGVLNTAWSVQAKLHLQMVQEERRRLDQATTSDGKAYKRIRDNMDL